MYNLYLLTSSKLPKKFKYLASAKRFAELDSEGLSREIPTWTLTEGTWLGIVNGDVYYEITKV